MSRNPPQIRSFDSFHRLAARHDSALEESIFTGSGIKTYFWLRPGETSSTRSFTIADGFEGFSTKNMNF